MRTGIIEDDPVIESTSNGEVEGAAVATAATADAKEEADKTNQSIFDDEDKPKVSSCTCCA